MLQRIKIKVSLFLQTTANKIKINKNIVLILILILLIGGILRLYHLTFQSLWLDELITVCHSMPDYGFMNMIEHSSKLGKTPPLFYILLWLWQHIFGSSEFAVRMLPALFGIAGILGVYFLGAAIFSRKTGIFAAMTTALLSFHIYYSQETRSYSLLFLLASLSYLFLIKIIKQPNTKNIFLYIVITSLMLYTHYFVFFIFAAQIFFIVWYFLFSREISFIKLLKSFGPAFIVPVLLYIPWIPNLIKMVKLNSFWTTQPKPTFIIRYFKRFFGTETLLIILTVLFIANYIIDKNSQSKFKASKLLLFSWVFISLMIPYVRSFYSPSPLTVRNTIVILPAILLMISNGIEKFKPISLQYFSLTSVLFLLTINIFYTQGNYFHTHTKGQWRQLVESIIKNDPDLKYPLYTIKNKEMDKYFDYYFNTIFKKKVKLYPKIFDIESIDSRYNDIMFGKIPGFWLLEAHFFIDDSMCEYLENHFLKKNEIVLHKTRATLFIPNKPPLINPEDWEKSGEKAIEIFKNATDKNPSIPFLHELWIKLGELYINTGRMEEALDAIQNAIQLCPENARFRILLGNYLLKSNLYNEALDSYKKGAELNPDYKKQSWFYIKKAIVLESMGKIDQAALTLEQAIQIESEIEILFDLWIKLGDLYNKYSNYEKALSAYNEASKLNPNEAWLYGRLGEIHSLLNQPKSAVSSYQKALLLEKDKIEASTWLIKLGDLNIADGHLDQAEQFYKEAIEKNPEKALYRILLANALFEQQKFNESLREYKKAAELEPDYNNNLSYLAKLGIIYNNIKSYEEAITIFQKVLEIDPKNSSTLRLLGNTYYSMEKMELALKSYQTAVLINPQLEQDSQFLLRIAHTLYILEQYEEVKIIINKALNLEPENTRGLQLLKNLEKHLK